MMVFKAPTAAQELENQISALKFISRDIKIHKVSG